MGWLFRSIMVSSLVATFGITACVERSEPDDGLDPPEARCIDRDDDGYGVHCEAGLDCDDTNAAIQADCSEGMSCTHPRAGCPCEDEGEEIECRTPNPIVSDDGASLCYAGVRACQDLLWGTCDSLYSYDPLSEDDLGGDGIERGAILGHPEPCMGSCDTGCMSIYDCPSQPDFTVENSNNIRYDLQRTVGEGDEAVTLPSAMIIADGETEGWFIRSLSAVCGAEQMTTWWALDFEVNMPSEEGIRLYIEARAADSPDGFVDLLPWKPLIECPEGARVGSCDTPENPHDRQFVDDANLYDALGFEDARRQNLQLRVRLVRDSADIDSPRFMHIQTYFFCGEAS